MHLEEGKPLLQFLHREHLDSYEAHSFDDADDGKAVVLGVSDLVEEPPAHRMEPGLREHAYDLCVEVGYLLHALYVGISGSPRRGGRKGSISHHHTHM